MDNKDMEEMMDLEDVSSPVVDQPNQEVKVSSNDEVIPVEPVMSTPTNVSKEEVAEVAKKSKTPLIVLLSILLVLDVAALVIYLIGFDKVFSFIK